MQRRLHSEAAGPVRPHRIRLEKEAGLAMETEERAEQPQKKEPETVTMTVAERDAIIRERDEAKRSEREWANRALANGHNGNGQRQEEVEEPPDIVDTEDLLP